MTPCLLVGRTHQKNASPPSLCGRRVYVPSTWSEIDTRTIDQAVGWETDPNS